MPTCADETLPPVDAEVGIDLGLTHFAVLSDGTQVAAPKFWRRAARKLRRLQQDLCRKRPGRANRGKAAVMVAEAHATVADTRRDWQHKLSTAIIRNTCGLRRGLVRDRSRPDPASSDGGTAR